MAIRQKAVSIYPTGYTGTSWQDLNTLLSQGWIVKIALPEVDTKKGDTKHVLILEKEDKQDG